MDDKALGYIGLVNYHQQFPAARVAYGAEKGETIYMYQCSSSSTAESMNAANKLVRDWTAVDPINAMILILKLEAKRYCDNKEKALECMRFLHHMDRSSPIMLSSLLIRGTIQSALNMKWIDMPALCHQTGLTAPTTVGFPPHMM